MDDIHGDFAEVLREIKTTGEAIAAGDKRTKARIDAIESSVNDIFRQLNRPGGEGASELGGDERKDAIGLCQTKHLINAPRDDGSLDDYFPSESEIAEALTAKKAISKLFRNPDSANLGADYRKSLSSFSFGNSG